MHSKHRHSNPYAFHRRAIPLLSAALFAFAIPGTLLAQSGTVHVVQDRVNVRKGPGAQFERVTLLDKETTVTVLERQGEWAHIQSKDGHNGWLLVKFLNEPAARAAGATVNRSDKPAAADKPTPPSETAVAPAAVAPQTVPAAKPADSAAVPTKGTPPAAGAVTTNTPPASPSVSIAPPPVNLKPSPVKLAPAKKEAAASVPLADAKSDAKPDTKPDAVPQTQDSPAASLGDSWKLLLYLVPILGVTLLAIRGMKSVYQRTGHLPTLKQGLVGGLNLSNARKNGGSSLRVRESIPLGTAGLHLVEARGKLLLIGTAGNGVSLLTTFEDVENERRREFQEALQDAANDMDEDELVAELNKGQMPLEAVVRSLDSSLQSARETIERSASRVRSWDEADVQAVVEEAASPRTTRRTTRG